MQIGDQVAIQLTSLENKGLEIEELYQYASEGKIFRTILAWVGGRSWKVRQPSDETIVMGSKALTRVQASWTRATEVAQ